MKPAKVLDLRDLAFLYKLVRKIARVSVSSDKETEKLAKRARSFMKKHGMEEPVSKHQTFI